MTHPFTILDTTEQKEILLDTAHHALRLCANLIVLIMWLAYAAVWACVFIANTLRSTEFHYRLVVFLMDLRDRVPHSVTAITPGVWTKIDQWLDMLHLTTRVNDDSAMMQEVDAGPRSSVDTGEDEDE